MCEPGLTVDGGHATGAEDERWTRDRDPQNLSGRRRSRRGADARPYLLERVGEAAIVQLYADGFAALPRREKLLVWHLAQAAIAGRDIYFDQRYAHNLEMRELLEALVPEWPRMPDDVREPIVRYTKLFWINSGPHNNLTAQKFVLECSPDAFERAVHEAVLRGARMPSRAGEPLDALLSRRPAAVLRQIGSPDGDEQDAGRGAGHPHGQREQPVRRRHGRRPRGLRGVVPVELAPGEARRRARRRRCIASADATRPTSSGCARHLRGRDAVRDTGHGPRARGARALLPHRQHATIGARTTSPGCEDRDSPVDTINGFVEIYLDARGRKGAWEALVYYLHPEKTAAISRIAEHAQWFEDRMPWDPRYRKPRVTGVTARAIEVVIETGDSGPVTPIGINLPNDQEIRETHGSKSVSLSNVLEAYEKSHAAVVSRASSAGTRTRSTGPRAGARTPAS